MSENILYLTYTGLLEPLGRSQVINYLARLEGYKFTVISFEKPDLLKNTEVLSSLRNELVLHNIDWRPMRYHKSPRVLASSWDVLQFVFSAMRISLSKSDQPDIIHCRSYIPAIAGWLCSRIIRIPYIFDMRALWVDELVSANRLKQSSYLYRVLKWVEARLLRDASTIVSLTDAAVVHLKAQHPRLQEKNFTVITTCVDLERFKVQGAGRKDGPLRMGAMGTLTSGWFHLDWLFRFYAAVKARFPDVIFTIITRDDPAKLRAMAHSLGLDQSSIHITAAQPAEVANHLAQMDFAAMFFKAEVGKLGSAPTRMGELLACGIPVVGNAGVGDMADLIKRYDVGVVLEDGSDAAIEKAVNELAEYLLRDSISDRCSSTASDYFSVTAGARKYDEAYQYVLEGKK